MGVLSQLNRTQRDALRSHQAVVAHFETDVSAQLTSASKPESMKTFVEKLLELTDSSGKIHKRPRRPREPVLPAGDRLSGLTKVVNDGPTEPLQGYFDTKIWQKARDFAREDAVVEADHLLQTRDRDAREASMRAWAAKTSQRDRALERMFAKPPAAAVKYGYGPDGGAWEQVKQPPILSVLRAKAVPATNKGLALATAVAIQKGTGLRAVIAISSGKGDYHEQLGTCPALCVCVFLCVCSIGLLV